MRSLRETLLWGSILGTAGVFIIAGALLYMLLRANLIAQIDLALREKARLIAANVEYRGSEISAELNWLSGERADQPTRDYFLLSCNDGSTIDGSPILRSADLSPDLKNLESSEYLLCSLPNDVHGRAFALEFQPDEGEENNEEGETGSQHEAGNSTSKAGVANKGRERTAAVRKPVRLLLIRDISALDSTLATVRAILLTVGIAAIAIAGIVLTVVVGHGLRPLNKLAAEIGTLDSDDLSLQIDQPLPRELAPLVDRLNDLLNRLTAAFERERAFSADVAHELRTPLTGLRSTIEVALFRAREPAEYQESLAECQGIAVQLQRLVENLLVLARLESGVDSFHVDSINLNQLLIEEWKTYESAAAKRELQMDWLLGDVPELHLDDAHLRLVVRNLFSNAVTYADTAGTVRIATAQNEGFGTLSVTNSGSKIESRHAEDVFKRFWRGSKDRTEVGVRFGLGLPLAKKVVTAIGGTICAKTTVNGNFEISVALPIDKNHTTMQHRLPAAATAM